MRWPWLKNKVYDDIINEMIREEEAEAKKMFRENRHRGMSDIIRIQRLISEELQERIRESNPPIVAIWKRLSLYEKIVLVIMQLLSANLVISLVCITTNIMWEYIAGISGMLFFVFLFLFILKKCK